MRKRGKLNKLKVSIVIIIVVLMIAITVFGRYIYNSIRETYFLAEQFYFSSDILTMNNPDYTYTDWGGTSVHEIEFELHSYVNELTKLDYDLDYTVSCALKNASDSQKVRIRSKFRWNKCTNNNNRNYS